MKDHRNTTRALIEEDVAKQRSSGLGGPTRAIGVLTDTLTAKLLDQAALDLVIGTFAALGPKAFPTEFHRALALARAGTNEELGRGPLFLESW